MPRCQCRHQPASSGPRSHRLIGQPHSPQSNFFGKSCSGRRPCAEGSNVSSMRSRHSLLGTKDARVPCSGSAASWPSPRPLPLPVSIISPEMSRQAGRHTEENSSTPYTTNAATAGSVCGPSWRLGAALGGQLARQARVWGASMYGGVRGSFPPGAVASVRLAAGCGQRGGRHGRHVGSGAHRCVWLAAER